MVTSGRASADRKRQKATVCLDSAEVCQLVFIVYKELIEMYGSPEHLESMIFANCPKLYDLISKLIVKSILKSPPRKPTEM